MVNIRLVIDTKPGMNYLCITLKYTAANLAIRVINLINFK